MELLILPLIVCSPWCKSKAALLWSYLHLPRPLYFIGPQLKVLRGRQIKIIQCFNLWFQAYVISLNLEPKWGGPIVCNIQKALGQLPLGVPFMSLSISRSCLVQPCRGWELVFRVAFRMTLYHTIRPPPVRL